MGFRRGRSHEAESGEDRVAIIGAARLLQERGRVGRRHWWMTRLVLLAAVYFIAGKLGLMLAFVHASATAVWPPAGIALAAFLVWGYRVWPAILLGAFLVNVTTAGSVATSLGIALGNTLEGVVGAALVIALANGRDAFRRAPDIFKFAFLAGVVSTTVSATLGVTSLALGGFADWADYGSIWLTWWLGDAGGDMVVAPALILWSANRRLGWTRREMLEAGSLLACLVLLGQSVFGGWLPAGMKNHPLEFLCIPLLLWAAFRFGQREAATAVVLLSGIAIWGTLHGSGPFARGTQNEALLLLQAFMGMIAMTSIATAAVVTERQRTTRELQEALDRIKTLRGLLPICSSCNKIRNDAGRWVPLEIYIQEHSEARFTHGFCPSCVERHYPELYPRLAERRPDIFRKPTSLGE